MRKEKRVTRIIVSRKLYRMQAEGKGKWEAWHPPPPLRRARREECHVNQRVKRVAQKEDDKDKTIISTSLEHDVGTSSIMYLTSLLISSLCTRKPKYGMLPLYHLMSSLPPGSVEDWQREPKQICVWTIFRVQKKQRRNVQEDEYT